MVTAVFSSVGSPTNPTVAVRAFSVASVAKAADEDTIDLEVDGHTVSITHPDKVFFTTRNDTKLDLVRYYVRMGDSVMRQMGDRPVLLQRFPNGASSSSFFQKRIPDSAPEWLQTTIVSTPNGTTSRALVVADLAHLIWAVNLGCLGFHS
ncbi:MAG: ligase, partial [Ilumatobacteraceae bacterium]|nr:ligase [Ilumatobacteraceae bacterium]